MPSTQPRHLCLVAPLAAWLFENLSFGRSSPQLEHRKLALLPACLDMTVCTNRAGWPPGARCGSLSATVGLLRRRRGLRAPLQLFYS